MYLVQNLNKEKEIYKLDQVNCMEKPIAIMLDGYNQIYRHIFHLFMKMMQSYNLNYYKEIDFSNLRTMSRVDIIMNREMNIKLKSKNKFSSCEDFCNFIDLNYFPNLREIIIINFGINNFEFDILERCRKLKVIELIDCDITERGRREIQDAKNSDIIVIENFNRENVSQLVKFISLDELRNLYSKKESTDYLSRVIKLKILNLTDSEYDKNLEAYLNNK